MDLNASQSAWNMVAQIGSDGENAFLQSQVLVTSASLKPFARERNEIDLSCILVKSI